MKEIEEYISLTPMMHYIKGGSKNSIIKACSFWKTAVYSSK
jgi:hypothetical protein